MLAFSGIQKEQISDLHGGDGVEAKPLNFEIWCRARILVSTVKSSNGSNPEAAVRYERSKAADRYINILF
jgi:hypothetical protein